MTPACRLSTEDRKQRNLGEGDDTILSPTFKIEVFFFLVYLHNEYYTGQ